MKWTEMLSCSMDSLREHYWSCRSLAYNNASMAQHCAPKSRTNRKLANQMGFLMRQVSMCENAAKRRGESLAF
ncbi:MAG: hypothetical protein GWN58_32850 [Anaerolineae bacterium]|nr:hypothetical protein [Thermoplasmata archaeon]NIV34065.1 hypothetical protein [Anaerolineae bacterium]NIY05916.1 hypothetical protein [Thermoplasmata archaeon]